MSNLWCPELYTRAWSFATRKHANQTYGGSNEGEQIPYINHISSVAMEVSLGVLKAKESLNANLAIQCALLHDTIEDTNATYFEVCEIFGRDVADGVMALSKDDALPTKEAKMENSIARIKLQPKEIWMVKLADRITNLYHPPFYWTDEKILSYQEEARYILRALGESSVALGDRLEQKINEYPKFLKARV
jgi:(p)ppGpp synthase/HD superfamily hydrolase